MFENKVLIKIFGAKRGEITGEWKRLHNAELHALYSSPNIIKQNGGGTERHLPRTDVVGSAGERREDVEMKRKSKKIEAFE